MTNKVLKRAPLLLAALVAAGLASQAHAIPIPQAYALAYDNVYNGQIQFISSGGGTIIVGAQVPNVGASSTLNGVPGLTGGCSGLQDCPTPATLGYAVTGTTPGAITNNAFVAFGQAGSIGSNYGWGDSHIVTEQGSVPPGPCPGNCFQGVNEGESSVGAGNFATGNGNLGSGTGLVINFNIGGAGTEQLDLTFNAAPYLQVFLDADSKGAPDQAAATLTATATITNQFGQTIFSYAPDGSSTANGGSVLAEGFGLNLTAVSSLPFQLGNFIYDPCGFGAPPTGEGTPPGACKVANLFHVKSNPLPTGTYQFRLQLAENTNVNRTPEPASIALLGLGLTGLALTRRRRARK